MLFHLIRLSLLSFFSFISVSFEGPLHLYIYLQLARFILISQFTGKEKVMEKAILKCVRQNMFFKENYMPWHSTLYFLSLQPVNMLLCISCLWVGAGNVWE